MRACARASVCYWRVLDSLELELQVVVSHLIWVLGTKLGPPEEQLALLTAEPSLQCHVRKYFVKPVPVLLFTSQKCISEIFRNYTLTRNDYSASPT